MQTITLNDKTFDLYLSEPQLQERIKSLAIEINEVYRETPPLLIGVLKGSFIFMADLIRHLTVLPEVHFVQISTYGDGMIAKKKPQIDPNFNVDIANRHIIIVEDIVDTGYTATFLLNYLKQRSPASVRLMTLLHKPASQVDGKAPDFIGFSIPPEFVVGYGLDYAQKGREFRGIYRLKS
ncbi:UNVERIFIED_CONTAM: hypothetical protein GTU68_042220 [Idotea baltica]|nr:hypothetical protein [Idotea baltica]